MLKLTPAEQPVWDGCVVAMAVAIHCRESNYKHVMPSGAREVVGMAAGYADALIEARREREGKQEP